MGIKIWLHKCRVYILLQQSVYRPSKRGKRCRLVPGSVFLSGIGLQTVLSDEITTTS